MEIEGAKLALNGGLLNGNRWIGAMTSETNEFPDRGAYDRIAVTLVSWRRTNDGRADNAAALNFPTPTATLQRPIHIGMWDEDGVGEGNLLYVWPSVTANGGVTPNAPVSGSLFGFDARSLAITLASSDNKLTAAGAKAAYETGLVEGTRYLSLHTAEPTAQGGSQIDDSVAVPSNVWTAVSGSENTVRNRVAVQFGEQRTDVGRPTWVALRDGSANNANVLWKTTVSGTVDDPAAGATITVLPYTLTVGFNV